MLAPALPAADPPVRLDVDWDAALGRHDPRWPTLPTRPRDAPMIGNGRLGAYLTVEPDGQALRLEFSRTDLVDVRSEYAAGKVRKPNGCFRLVLPGGPVQGTCRLDLPGARLAADLTTAAGSWRLGAFVDVAGEVLVVDLEPGAGTSGPGTWDFVPDLRPWTDGYPVTPSGVEPYPPPERRTQEGCEVSLQVMPVDARYRTRREPAPSEHATAWRVEPTATGTRLVAALGLAYRRTGAATEAVGAVRAAVAEGLDRVASRHQAWWRAFYARSFVALPATWERWHWLQLYKIGSMARPDLMTDLTGPWFDRKILWNGIWFNWNTQKMYAHVFTANHPELADGVLDFLWKHRDAYREPGSGGYAVPWGGVSGLDGRFGDAKASAGDPACLIWLLALAWERYQVTQDPTGLAERFAPLLIGALDFARARLLVEGPDGLLHVKARGSPEFRSRQGKHLFEDTTFQLSSLRWACRTLGSLHARLGIAPEAAAEAARLLARLAPYAIDPEQGFLIAKGQPLDVAHRHDSHELAIWPYGEFLPSDPAQRQVIERTLDTHRRVGFQDQPGMANGTWALLSTHLGRGDDAVGELERIITHRWLSPTTTRSLQGENRAGGQGYCEEVPFLLARVIQDLLLQEWGDGVIRVFPALPTSPEWQDVAVHDLLAKGAFLVSARRQGGVTRFVQIRSLAGEPCTVQSGLAGPLQVTSSCGATATEVAPGVVRLAPLPKGAWCLLAPAGTAVDPVIRPRP